MNWLLKHSDVPLEALSLINAVCLSVCAALCLYSHWCTGVCGGGTLSREGLPGFGSTSWQRPEIPGSDLPGFQSDLNNNSGHFMLTASTVNVIPLLQKVDT